MANVDLLIKALDSAYWEMSEAFQGLSDDHTWRRPHSRLLSIGEIAAHVCYWQAQSFLGSEKIPSCLILEDARYYTSNINHPFKLTISSNEVITEVQRVYSLCKESFFSASHDSEDPNPNRGDWTWGATLEYQIFHVGYHTGQIYTVRHLFGNETVDN